MIKKVFLLLFAVTLFAINDNSKIKNLIGVQKYQKYHQLIQRIFPKRNYDITEIVTKLKNNGLLDLFFRRAKIIDTKFEFKNGNPILEQKILNNSLTSLGYYYFYPVSISKKDNNYNLTLEMKSEHYIDPVALIKEFQSRGCQILDVSKQNTTFNYKVDCSDAFIKEIKELSDTPQHFLTPTGVYWLKTDNFKSITIETSKNDYWHPSIWFYDKNLNVIGVHRENIVKNSLKLKIPSACKYIKIIDIYSPENFKRGIDVKGNLNE